MNEIKPHQRGRRPKTGEWRILHRKDGTADRRSLRRTGRDILFAARVSEAFGPTIKEIAAREKRTVGEVLEDALRNYSLLKEPKPPGGPGAGRPARASRKPGLARGLRRAP